MFFSIFIYISTNSIFFEKFNISIYYSDFKLSFIIFVHANVFSIRSNISILSFITISLSLYQRISKNSSHIFLNDKIEMLERIEKTLACLNKDQKE